MITRGLNDVIRTLDDPVPYIMGRMKATGDVCVLEIGCGIGNALAELAELFPEAHFYGFNKRAFPCQRLAGNISYVYGDAGCHLPFEDNSIDFVYSIHTFQFIADKVGLLNEVHRVLKESGEFWFNISDTIDDLNGANLCTVSDGVETISFKDFIKFINIPEFRFMMRLHKDKGFSYVSPSFVVFKKLNQELRLPIKEDFRLTDLSLEFPGKDGYLASHYYTESNITLRKMKKVLVIAASPHGYGHLYRGETISRYLTRNGFDVAYLSNNTDPLLHGDDEQYSTFVINMHSDPEGENARRHLLDIVGSQKFDVVLVDHFPLGKLFFLDSFKVLYEKMHKTAKFVCVFRDIFSIDDFRQRTESISVLNRYFDRLLVLSDPDIIPLPDFLTNDINIPVDYLGFLDPECGNPQITIFGGGGKFNMPFYQQTLEVIKENGLDTFFSVKLFTGRTLPEEDREKLVQLFPSISISDHSDDLMNEIKKSSITISTFGYNTFVQLIKFNNYNIIVPLPKNFQEQYSRSEVFVSLKDKASIVMLDLKYKETLSRKLSDITGRMINLKGLPALAQTLYSL